MLSLSLTFENVCQETALVQFRFSDLYYDCQETALVHFRFSDLYYVCQETAPNNTELLLWYGNFQVLT